MTLTKITVTGQYTPKHDKVNPLIIGGVTFNPYLELTANVKEDVFLNLLRGFRTPEPWFVLVDHNYPEYINSRRVPANPEIEELLAVDMTPDPQEEVPAGAEDEDEIPVGDETEETPVTEEIPAGEGEEVPVDKTEEISISAEGTGEATPAETTVTETVVEEAAAETPVETEQVVEEAVEKVEDASAEDTVTETVTVEAATAEEAASAVEAPTSAPAETETKSKRGKKSSK